MSSHCVASQSSKAGEMTYVNMPCSSPADVSALTDSMSKVSVGSAKPKPAERGSSKTKMTRQERNTNTVDKNEETSKGDMKARTPVGGTTNAQHINEVGWLEIIDPKL